MRPRPAPSGLGRAPPKVRLLCGFPLVNGKTNSNPQEPAVRTKIAISDAKQHQAQQVWDFKPKAGFGAGNLFRCRWRCSNLARSKYALTQRFNYLLIGIHSAPVVSELRLHKGIPNCCMGNPTTANSLLTGSSLVPKSGASRNDMVSLAAWILRTPNDESSAD